MKKGIAALLVLILTIGLFTGCGDDLPLVYVQTVSEIMGYGDLGESNVCAGVVVSQGVTKIPKDQERKVIELKVAVGQEVQEGEVLFVYDTAELQLSIDKAKLELEQLKNSVKDYKAQIAQLEKEKKAASKDDQLSYTIQIQAVELDQKEAEYYVSAKEKDIALLEANLHQSDVRSPIAGVVQSINEQGGYDSFTGEELPYITLMESGVYRVKGSVNELTMDTFFVGQTVTVRSRANVYDYWTGTIESVETAPEEDSGDNFYGAEDELTSSSTYPFYVTMDNTEGLILGQHVYIEEGSGIPAESENIWLSAVYVMDELGIYSVWAVDDDERIEKRTVTVGSYDEQSECYEITGGLTLEDLIAYPAEEVQAGAPITRTLPQEELGEEDELVEGEDMTGNAVEGTVENEGIIEEGIIKDGIIDDDMAVGETVGDGAAFGEGIVVEDDKEAEGALTPVPVLPNGGGA